MPRGQNGFLYDQRKSEEERIGLTVVAVFARQKMKQRKNFFIYTPLWMAGGVFCLPYAGQRSWVLQEENNTAAVMIIKTINTETFDFRTTMKCLKLI